MFTEYVRSLEPGREPREPRHFAEAWAALRAALVAEMKKRGLWDAPPSYLGVYGCRSWTEGPEPVQDLLTDCYTYVFIDRLRSLAEHVRLKANVEGLVFLSVRHFLHDTQKRHDPLGFRVFTVVEAAVRGLVDRGTLHVAGGPSRIRNDTLLAFASDGAHKGAEPPHLAPRVARWVPGLLPALVTAQGEPLHQVVGQVEQLVASLADAGVQRFSFRELIDPLKKEVRACWGLALAEAPPGEVSDLDPELTTLVRQAEGCREVEERDSFEKLLSTVAAGIEALGEPESVKRDLRRLLGLLGTWADGEESLSRRKVALLLDLSRDRVGILYGILGRLVREARRPRASRRGRESGVSPVTKDERA